jgi:lysophospholipase L1-like esterase
MRDSRDIAWRDAGRRGSAGRRSIATVALAAVVLVVFAGAASAATYTALGDSYSSGVGTRSFYNDGTECKRSPLAYPAKVAADRKLTLTFAACSGAKTGDVLSKQLGSLNSSTAYVTISIGGNDAGFSNVITECALPWPWTCWGGIENAEKYMRNTLPGLLDNVYNQIHAKAPAAEVIVVGYPRLFNGVECNGLARISKGEQERLNQAADVMAGVISARANAHAFKFVDPRTAFSSHEICSSSEWLNGLSNPVSESYHPNVSGQQDYTNEVEAKL